MIKYAKVINEETKECQVGIGTNTEFYQKIGMTQLDVEQAYNGSWYLTGHCPSKPEPTLQEQVNSLEQKYGMNRWQREMILAEGSSASDYAKREAQEIETLAEQLREE